MLERYKNFLMALSLACILFTFSSLLSVVIYYTTLLEYWIRMNMDVFMPVAGVAWVATLVSILSSHLKARAPMGKIWVIDEKYLEKYHGYYEGHVEQAKPTMVRKVSDE